MPTTNEYVAHGRTTEEVAAVIGVDWLVYQDLSDLEECVRCLNPSRLNKFDSSCFNGDYIAGNVDQALLHRLAMKRNTTRTICSS